MYVAVFILLALIGSFDSLFKKNYWCILSIVILSAFAGLRSLYVGADTYNYYYDYENILNKLAPINSHEVGFVTLEKLFGFFNAPFWMFAFFISLITIFLLYVGYSSLTDKVGLAFLYYYARFYLSRDMNQVRSSLACAIILCSLRFVVKKKLGWFLTAILLAALIHSGAVIAALVYPSYFLFKRFNPKHLFRNYIAILILSMIASYLLKPVIANINTTRTDAYIHSTEYMSNLGLLNPVILIQIILSLTTLFVYLHAAKVDSIIAVTFISYAISTILLITLSQYYGLAGRTSTFLTTVEPILLIYVLNSKLRPFFSYCSFLVITIAVFISINFFGFGFATQFVYTTFFN